MKKTISKRLIALLCALLTLFSIVIYNFEIKPIIKATTTEDMHGFEFSYSFLESASDIDEENPNILTKEASYSQTILSQVKFSNDNLERDYAIGEIEFYFYFPKSPDVTFIGIGNAINSTDTSHSDTKDIFLTTKDKTYAYYYDKYYDRIVVTNAVPFSKGEAISGYINLSLYFNNTNHFTLSEDLMNEYEFNDDYSEAYKIFELYTEMFIENDNIDVISDKLYFKQIFKLGHYDHDAYYRPSDVFTITDENGEMYDIYPVTFVLTGHSYSGNYFAPKLYYKVSLPEGYHILSSDFSSFKVFKGIKIEDYFEDENQEWKEYFPGAAGGSGRFLVACRHGSNFSLMLELGGYINDTDYPWWSLDIYSSSKGGSSGGGGGGGGSSSPSNVSYLETTAIVDMNDENFSAYYDYDTTGWPNYNIVNRHYFTLSYDYLNPERDIYFEYTYTDEIDLTSYKALATSAPRDLELSFDLINAFPSDCNSNIINDNSYLKSEYYDYAYCDVPKVHNWTIYTRDFDIATDTIGAYEKFCDQDTYYEYLRNDKIWFPKETKSFKVIYDNIYNDEEDSNTIEQYGTGYNVPKWYRTKFIFGVKYSEEILDACTDQGYDSTSLYPQVAAASWWSYVVNPSEISTNKIASSLPYTKPYPSIEFTATPSTDSLNQWADVPLYLYDHRMPYQPFGDNSINVGVEDNSDKNLSEDLQVNLPNYYKKYPIEPYSIPNDSTKINTVNDYSVIDEDNELYCFINAKPNFHIGNISANQTNIELTSLTEDSFQDFEGGRITDYLIIFAKPAENGLYYNDFYYYNKKTHKYYQYLFLENEFYEINSDGTKTLIAKDNPYSLSNDYNSYDIEDLLRTIDVPTSSEFFTSSYVWDPVLKVHYRYIDDDKTVLCVLDYFTSSNQNRYQPTMNVIFLRQNKRYVYYNYNVQGPASMNGWFKASTDNYCYAAYNDGKFDVLGYNEFNKEKFDSNCIKVDIPHVRNAYDGYMRYNSFSTVYQPELMRKLYGGYYFSQRTYPYSQIRIYYPSLSSEIAVNNIHYDEETELYYGQVNSNISWSSKNKQVIPMSYFNSYIMVPDGWHINYDNFINEFEIDYQAAYWNDANILKFADGTRLTDKEEIIKYIKEHIKVKTEYRTIDYSTGSDKYKKLSGHLISVNYDFSDNPIISDPDKFIKFSFNFTIQCDPFDNVRNYDSYKNHIYNWTIMDEKNNLKYPKDFEYSPRPYFHEDDPTNYKDVNDFNSNGITDEVITYNVDDCYTYTSAGAGLQSFVKDATSIDFEKDYSIDESKVLEGQDYNYRIRFTTAADTLSQFCFVDNLEAYRDETFNIESDWKGTFESVDTSYFYWLCHNKWLIFYEK